MNNKMVVILSRMILISISSTITLSPYRYDQHRPDNARFQQPVSCLVLIFGFNHIVHSYAAVSTGSTEALPHAPFDSHLSHSNAGVL